MDSDSLNTGPEANVVCRQLLEHSIVCNAVSVDVIRQDMYLSPGPDMTQSHGARSKLLARARISGTASQASASFETDMAS